MFKDFNAIAVGETHSLVKVITEADVRKFVEMTGDDNPLHVNRSYAETTSFKDIVVHGMLGASFLSTVIGTKIPGPGALWVSQNLDFLLPVRLGDELTISCTVLKKNDRERLLELESKIVNQNQQLVLSGIGKVKMLAGPTPPAQDSAKAHPLVAIVTGGAGGIGRAICLRLAQEGYNVVVNYRGRSEAAAEIVAEINRGATRAVAVQADISTDQGAQILHDTACREFGGASVLINNASPQINPKDFSATSWGDFQKQIDVQVKGAFLMAKACIPRMAECHWGRIINITSQAIEGQPTIGWTGYAVAKGALATLSKYLAAEFGPQGITVNCIAPGMCETALIGNIPEKAQLIAARQTPLRRLAKPSDVASAVIRLVSEDGAFVTGQTISVNGGMVMR